MPSVTVLLAEDEAGVRAPLRRILVARGYSVLEAANGREAYEIARAHQGGIDLLLTDVVMPEMGGAELARRLREERPGIRVLFITGFSREAVAGHGVLAPDSSLLQKPFTPHELLHRIEEVLGNAP